ncbi:MAG: diaminobutyrate acetyltransferase [Planctomycetaceae bacterium]|nr:diaminobutyrate acetyltransferase [Planctomycetaceae bacterium]
MPQTTSAITFRPPQLQDAAAIHSLVEATGVLDCNSAYLYLLLCRHFRDTCLVADADGRIAGFVTAYRPVRHPQTLFVWQIGVDATHRRQQIGSRLLTELVDRCRRVSPVRFVEATIADSNTASAALFHRLAEQWNVPFTRLPEAGFADDLFPRGHRHEAEPLIRIGPMSG